MKRYCIVIGDRGDGIHEPIGMETPAGQFVAYPDLHAWAPKHKATLEKIDLRPWRDCACSTCRLNIASHADALREIEEIIGHDTPPA